MMKQTPYSLNVVMDLTTTRELKHSHSEARDAVLPDEDTLSYVLFSVQTSYMLKPCLDVVMYLTTSR